MGMFDSIYLPLKCPVCGDEGEKECQTKDLRCYLDTYHIGDSIGTKQFRWLDVIACCITETCKTKHDEKVGYRSGFGSSWDGWVEVDEKGLITGRFETEIPS